jgi:uncharacterized protein YjbJ (UPF0337 family)
MTTDRADELKGRMIEADGPRSDNEATTREGTRDHATPVIQTVVSEHRWYYYHVSTP